MRENEQYLKMNVLFLENIIAKLNIYCNIADKSKKKAFPLTCCYLFISSILS